MTRGDAVSVLYNTLPYSALVLSNAALHCRNLFSYLYIFVSLLQPLSAVRHTIRSSNKQARAERTRSEIDCK